MTLTRSKQPAALALALGVLGGAALIVTHQVTTFGPAIYFPYTALVVATFFAIRLAGWEEFRDRFAAAFLAFMTATAVVYLFLTTVVNANLFSIPIWQHTAVIGLMAVIGTVLSAAIAYLADIGHARRG